MKRIVLKNWQAPGDCLVLTCALRDLHLNYPGEYETAVETPHPEVFFRNPYVTPMKREPDIPIIELGYTEEKMRAAFSGRHFSEGFVRDLQWKLGRPIQQSSIYPEIYLTEEEMAPDWPMKHFNLRGPYWLLNAGFKTDIPLKAYPPFKWEQVAAELMLAGVYLLQVGHDHHIHPIIDDHYVLSLIGCTNDLRTYFALCYHAEGMIGHVSLQMHVAAAFRKPCVVVAGGREDWRWEAYPHHQFLHTIGQLSCCYLEGCWLRQRPECSNMVGDPAYPKCMMMIKPGEIVEKVFNYVDAVSTRR